MQNTMSLDSFWGWRSRPAARSEFSGDTVPFYDRTPFIAWIQRIYNICDHKAGTTLWISRQNRVPCFILPGETTLNVQLQT